MRSNFNSVALYAVNRYFSTSDPEPYVDRKQQRRVTRAWLCCALWPRPLLHAASPPRSSGRYRFPGRAQSRQQPHGTDAHGQPFWGSRDGKWNQWLWSQRRSRPQILQHSCAADEGQGTQCSHLLGNMMSRARTTLPPYDPSLNHRQVLWGRREHFWEH